MAAAYRLKSFYSCFQFLPKCSEFQVKKKWYLFLKTALQKNPLHHSMCSTPHFNSRAYAWTWLARGEICWLLKPKSFCTALFAPWNQCGKFKWWIFNWAGLPRTRESFDLIICASVELVGSAFGIFGINTKTRLLLAHWIISQWRSVHYLMANNRIRYLHEYVS